MGVLATQMAALRTSLAAISGLTALPQNVQIDSPPDTDKTYFSVTCDVGGELGNEHGGGSLILYDGALIVVKLAWHIDVDEEAFNDTKANDVESINGVMHKASNWTAGVMLVTRSGGSERTEGTRHRADLNYAVRYRVAQNLT